LTGNAQRQERFMLKRLAILSLLLSASFPTSAQVLIDVAKINCNQFATYKIAHPDRIAIWLNGYFHGKRGDLVVDTQELGGNTDKVQEYCLKNPDVPLMQAVEALFGPSN
jgi:acid stress chaperone HdeB